MNHSLSNPKTIKATSSSTSFLCTKAANSLYDIHRPPSPANEDPEESRVIQDSQSQQQHSSLYSVDHRFSSCCCQCCKVRDDDRDRENTNRINTKTVGSHTPRNMQDDGYSGIGCYRLLQSLIRISEAYTKINLTIQERVNVRRKEVRYERPEVVARLSAGNNKPKTEIEWLLWNTQREEILQGEKAVVKARLDQIQREEEEAALREFGLSATEFAELKMFKTERNSRVHPATGPVEIELAVRQYRELKAVLRVHMNRS